SVTLALDQTLQRALAPVPADRFGSMAEFARALEPSHLPETVVAPVVRRRRRALRVAALGLAFVIGVGVPFAWRRTRRGGAASGPTHLAVLPFENLGSGANEYFADGVTDAVRGKLAALP